MSDDDYVTSKGLKLGALSGATFHELLRNQMWDMSAKMRGDFPWKWGVRTDLLHKSITVDFDFWVGDLSIRSWNKLIWRFTQRVWRFLIICVKIQEIYVQVNNWILHLKMLFAISTCHVLISICFMWYHNVHGPPVWNYMMTWSNGNIFRVTGHLCGEFTGPRWIPHTKASDAEPWYREAGDLRRYRAHYDVILMNRDKNGWVVLLLFSA